MIIMQYLNPILEKLNAQKALSHSKRYLETELAKLKAKRTLACLKVFVSYLILKFLKLEFMK